MLKRLVDGNALDDKTHDLIKLFAFAVIGRGNIVDAAIMVKVIDDLAFSAFWVDGDRMSAVIFGKDHGRDIGKSIADIDDVAIWDSSVAVLLINADIVIDVERAFRDAVEILGFLSVVDDELWPYWLIVLIKDELAAIDHLEVFVDGTAFDDFFVASVIFLEMMSLVRFGRSASWIRTRE